MEFDYQPYIYYMLPGLVGFLIGWRLFSGSAKLRAAEAEHAETEAALESARDELSELKRELASARDQVKPLADEVDRLTKEKAQRKTARAASAEGAGPATAAPTSTPPPRAASFAPGEKLPTFMESPTGPTDDLSQLKGVGPRLAARLREIGIYYFAQIADWSPEEVKLVDAKLDTFRGRIEKDKLIEQAKLIATGRMTEYEARFGKLGS